MTYAIQHMLIFLLLNYDLYFLIHATFTQIFSSIAELVILIGIPSQNAKI